MAEGILESVFPQVELCLMFLVVFVWWQIPGACCAAFLLELCTFFLYTHCIQWQQCAKFPSHMCDPKYMQWMHILGSDSTSMQILHAVKSTYSTGVTIIGHLQEWKNEVICCS